MARHSARTRLFGPGCTTACVRPWCDPAPAERRIVYHQRVRLRPPRRLAYALVIASCGLLVQSAASERVAAPRPALDSSKATSALVLPRRLYSRTSPFNRPIPRNVRIDPLSDHYVAGLAEVAQQGGFVIAVRRYSVPAYWASARTPRDRVSLTASWAPRRMMVAPIPPSARPDPASDGQMAVLDSSNGCEYDFWEAQKQGGTWSAAWGNAISFRGSGAFPGGLSARGSGFALLAGLMRPKELAAGRINHALIFSYPYTSSAGFVSPATESDGQTNRSDALPEGARLQLDPTFDVTSLPKYERPIARALQRYGMYLGETGSGNVSLYAINPQSYRTNPYRGVLPGGDYVDLHNIPLDRLRVIQLGRIRSSSKSARPSRCAKGATVHAAR
jgi:hypothetical protein